MDQLKWSSSSKNSSAADKSHELQVRKNVTKGARESGIKPDSRQTNSSKTNLSLFNQLR